MASKKTTSLTATSTAVQIIDAETPEQRLARLDARMAEVKTAAALIIGEILNEALEFGLHIHAGFPNIQSFAAEHWEMSAPHAFRCLSAYRTHQRLQNSPIGEFPMPSNEGQYRALAAVPDEAQTTVWLAALESAKAEGKPVTARHVKAEAEKLTKTSNTVSNAAHEAESKQTSKQGAKQKPQQTGSNLLPDVSAPAPAAPKPDPKPSVESVIFTPTTAELEHMAVCGGGCDIDQFIHSLFAQDMRRAEFATSNTRRADLLLQRTNGGLTPAQEIELENLQASTAAHVNKVAPIPDAPLDQFRAEAAAEIATKQPSRRVFSKGAEKTAPGADGRQAETGRQDEAALPVNAPTTPTPKAGPPYPPLTTADGTPYPRTVTMYPQGDARRRSQEIAFIRSLRSTGNGSRRETAVLA